MPDRQLPPIRRHHLRELTGPLGIWQHAIGTRPDESHGYCTDDVARALVVDLLHAPSIGWQAVGPDARRSLAFLRAAFDPDAGTFHDFRAADGAWLDAVGSEDCQGRALIALATTIRDVPDAAMRQEAGALFGAAMPAARRLTSPRAVASAIVACDAAIAAGFVDGSLRTLAGLAGPLRRAFDACDLDGPWPWPEAVLTYENALLPHALIVAGHRLDDAALGRMGLRVLDWLIRVQTAPGGHFSPIGNRGWWPRGGPRSRFDQQPIEASAMALAAAAAFRETRDERYRRAVTVAVRWFLGENDVGLVMADVETGGCHDGLSEGSVNANQGAESTLAWLAAVETLRSMQRRPAAAPRRRTRAPRLAGSRP